MLQNGRSWSGRERSCGFLNTRDGRFATSAAVTRLDDPGDARAAGITDWDGDGDLDIWVSNRTSPRLRLFRNPSAANTHFLRLRLVGVHCNRDAIGAMVELTPMARDDTSMAPTSRRFVRAGDGYLAQSSKWLHFGLGDSTAPLRLVITWPDESRQQIENVAPDRAYEIVQGRDRAEPVTPRQPSALVPMPISEPPSTAAGRIVVHRPLRVPRLEAHAHDATPVDVRPTGTGSARLLVVWASWCQPCLTELRALSDEQASFTRDGLEVWAANVDDLDEPLTERLAAARERLEQIAPQLAGGVLTRQTVEHLDLMQRIVLSRQEDLAVPTSFLLDSLGRLVVIYRGPVDLQQLRADLQLLQITEPRDYRNHAVPYAGRWYINPAPADLLAVPNQLLEEGKAVESFEYLRESIGTPQRPSASVDADWYSHFTPALAATYAQTGIELARQQQPSAAEAALQMALQVEPDHWNTLAALASLYGQQRQTTQELAIYERMLRVRPNDPMTTNNLAWILATSPDESLRRPERAIELAESLCEATQRRIFTPLDTLAAAYASAGRWDEAVQTAQEALQRPGGSATARAALEKRLAEYVRQRIDSQASPGDSPSSSPVQ